MMEEKTQSIETLETCHSVLTAVACEVSESNTIQEARSRIEAWKLILEVMKRLNKN